MEEKKKPQRVESTKRKKANMLIALEKSLGIVSMAAKKANVCRWSHYKWLKSDENYRIQAEQIDNLSLDFTESQLLKRIKEGSDACIIFKLKTHGRKRGYGERTEIDHTTKGEKITTPPMLFVSADDLTPEQLKEYIDKNLKSADSNNEGS